MKAFVTLLSSSNYVEGVLALHKSLQSVKSKYPLYCALSACIGNETERILSAHGVPTVRLSRHLSCGNISANGRGLSHWNKTFDKLQVWGLVRFEKIVFVDSDMLVVRNLDYLFDKPHFSAVCAGKSYPGNQEWEGLNSGLMVIEPCKEEEKILRTLTKTVVEDYQRKDLPAGDQNVLYEYFKDWGKRKSLHLDEGYNLFADYLTYYVRKLGYSLDKTGEKPVHVIHFVGKYKPWMKPGPKHLLWLMRMAVCNPMYFVAYSRYRECLKSCYKAA